MASRLKAIQAALKPRGKDVQLDPAASNAALPAAIARIDMNPVHGVLGLRWHHARDDTQDIQFPSRWVFQAA